MAVSLKGRPLLRGKLPPLGSTQWVRLIGVSRMMVESLSLLFLPAWFCLWDRKVRHLETIILRHELDEVVHVIYICYRDNVFSGNMSNPWNFRDYVKSLKFFRDFIYSLNWPGKTPYSLKIQQFQDTYSLIWCFLMFSLNFFRDFMYSLNVILGILYFPWM